MSTVRSFPPRVIESIRASMVIGIRAGSRQHRYVALWVVVVEGRIFVRSWGRKPEGWHRTLLEVPRATIEIHGRRFRVRTVQTRSERLKDLVSTAYAAKYHTPGSRRYVRDLTRAASRATTTELRPQ